MTTVCLEMGLTILTKTYQPYERLRDCVQNLLVDASAAVGGQELRVDGCEFSDSSQPIADWEEVRSLGSQSITVHASATSTSFGDMLRAMFAQQQAAEKREAVRDKGRVCNLATQIAMYACGQQSFWEPSTCSHFSALGPGHAGMSSLAGSLNISAATLVQQFDDVVTRRNCLFHPVSLATLDAEVKEMLQLVTPSLRQLCKWECFIVDNYAAIKSAYASRFSP